MGREDVNDAVDGLGGVVCVQGGDHQVPGLRGRQRGGDRLQVAHLAHQDHVRVLAQHAPQRLGEAERVLAHLPLVNDRLLAGVQELYRVLDGDDVDLALVVDDVNQGGLGGGLAVAGGPGDEDQPLGAQHQVAHLMGHAQLVQLRHEAGYHAERRRYVAALPVAVDPEAVLLSQVDREVQLLLRLEPRDLLVAEYLVDQPLGILRPEAVRLDVYQVAFHPQGRRHAGGQQHVGGALVHGELQDLRHRHVHRLSFAHRRLPACAQKVSLRPSRGSFNSYASAGRSAAASATSATTCSSSGRWCSSPART